MVIRKLKGKPIIRPVGRRTEAAPGGRGPFRGLLLNYKALHILEAT
jgi:hypothetical protein